MQDFMVELKAMPIWFHWHWEQDKNGRQAKKRMHMCMASSIRAMPEKVKPPAKLADIYFIVLFLKKFFRYAKNLLD